MKLIKFPHKVMGSSEIYRIKAGKRVIFTYLEADGDGMLFGGIIYGDEVIVLGNHLVIPVVIPAIGIDLVTVDKNINGSQFAGEHNGGGYEIFPGKSAGDSDDCASFYVFKPQI